MESNYEKVLENLKLKFLNMMHLNIENNWELFESYKDNITVHTKINPENGFKINRSQIIMPFSQEEILSIVSDPSHRANYDDKFEGSQLLKKIDENTAIFRSRIKPIAMVVSARDAVTIQRVYKENENILLIATSIDYPDCPVDKKYVRANMIIGGWHLKKLENGKTDVTTIGHSDPKGKIPTMIINQSPKFQAEMIRNLMNYIAKKKKL